MAKFSIISLCFVLTAFSQPDARSYYNEGRQYLNNKEYVQAIGSFTNAISLQPDMADAYFYRAYAKDLLAKKMGFASNELCNDLVVALKLGKTEAGERLEKSCMGECFNAQTAFQEPEMVYCADFSYNKIKDMPDGSDKLECLVRLSFIDNEITSIPQRITNIPTLVCLDISNNNIATVPANISKLKNLRDLNLNKNQIKELPLEFGNLKNLKVLTLRQNKLVELPKSIAQLTALENLDLAFNQLTSLPLEIANLKSLKTLTLVGNELSSKEQQKIKALLPNTTIYFD